MKIAFLGATKGLGRALARALAERGERLHLLARDVEDGRRSAADLAALGALGSARAAAGGTTSAAGAPGASEIPGASGAPATTGAGGTPGVSHCDLADPTTFGPALDAADAALGGLDCVVVTAAEFAAQERLEEDRARCDRLLTLDFVNTILFCEEARARLLGRGGGTLCVFSSVAGERARKPVVLYGAAKAGLSFYLEGLDHRFRARGLRTVCVKSSFVSTSMTDGLVPPPFSGRAEDVARLVLAALDRGTPVVYAPRIWRLLLVGVRLLPRWVLRRVRF